MLLNVTNLTIRTTGPKPVTLVNNLSFSLENASTLAVVGESGSGKTLTALAVMGLLPQGLAATAEAMSFNGENLLTLTPKQRRLLRGKHMGMIFQEPASALNPVLTCGQQVAESFIIHGLQGKAIGSAQRKAEVLKLFRQVQLPQPERIFTSFPHQLSGGQRQRVVIAMALAQKPALLIADEPTTALDVTVQAEILQLMQSLQQQHHMGMLFITHDFGVVQQLAQNVVVLQHGKFVESGPTKIILSKPKQAYTKQLLAATLAINPKPLKPNPKAEIVLQAEGLTHTYRRPGTWPWSPAEQVAALKNVALTLAAGHTVGVVGESGSGKSTLARVLTRLLPAEKGGRLVVMGNDFLALKNEPLRLARRNLQMVFQDPVTSLNPKLTIATTLAEGILAHRLLPPEKIPARIKQLLHLVGLPENAATRLPHQFSGGQRQRIAIARALALNPSIIVADEPVSALDVSVQAQILALFQSLQQTEGTAFVLISHDLRVISHLAHHTLVMRHGQVVESGPTAQIFQQPKHAYTKQLLKAVI